MFTFNAYCWLPIYNGFCMKWFMYLYIYTYVYVISINHALNTFLNTVIFIYMQCNIPHQQKY